MPGPYKISGALFPKDHPNGPVFGGVIEIEGTKYNISLWEKTSAKGTQYLQISEDKRAQGGGGAVPPAANKFARKPAAPPHKPSDDMDDDIPFAPEFR